MKRVFSTEKYITNYITFNSVLTNAKQNVGVCLRSLNMDQGSQRISKHVETLGPKYRDEERTQTTRWTKQPATVSRAQKLPTLTQCVVFNHMEHTSLSKFQKVNGEIRIILIIRSIILEPYALTFLSSSSNQQQLPNQLNEVMK